MSRAEFDRVMALRAKARQAVQGSAVMATKSSEPGALPVGEDGQPVHIDGGEEFGWVGKGLAAAAPDPKPAELEGERSTATRTNAAAQRLAAIAGAAAVNRQRQPASSPGEVSYARAAARKPAGYPYRDRWAFDSIPPGSSFGLESWLAARDQCTETEVVIEVMSPGGPRLERCLAWADETSSPGVRASALVAFACADCLLVPESIRAPVPGSVSSVISINGENFSLVRPRSHFEDERQSERTRVQIPDAQLIQAGEESTKDLNDDGER